MFIRQIKNGALRKSTSTYDSRLTNTSTPVSIFPNIQQQLYSFMSPVFLHIITSSIHLVLLDELGYLFVILSVDRRYYSSTIGASTAEIMPVFSTQITRYKKTVSANVTLTTCVNCTTNGFCPLVLNSMPRIQSNQPDLQHICVIKVYATHSFLQYMQDMIDILNIAFLNTASNCTSKTIISYSTLLLFRPIAVQFNLPNICRIGSIWIGLNASGNIKSRQNTWIILQLTKVINTTNSLVGSDDDMLSDYLTASPDG
ncbi:unnamed protein product [Adineta ricciae]|uniref:Uncharacterized protein n=1 Tax=Adineta ricciae TaxID=249248 RepID=A0A815ZWH7_ADIRI|nr:unnamed protein product [Adineta ricciae]